MPELPSATLKPPKQPRSQRTLERIVTSALSILEEQGPDGLTVQAVVERAQSSVGSFYARFGGKDDLLHYLAETVWEEALARWDAAVASEAWSEMNLAEVTEGAVGLLIEVSRSGAGHLQELDWMVGQGDAYQRFRGRVIDSLEGLLLERTGEIRHPKPELAVRLGLTAALGVLDSDVRRPSAESEGPEGPDVEEVLLEECTELLLAYLAGGSTDRGDGPVDFFEVWG